MIPANADSASVQVRSWIADRPPTRSSASAVSPSGPDTPTYTVPGGLPSWSSGPATPVVLTPYVAPIRARTPRAIARAHSAETTPCRSTSPRSTPSTSIFASVA